MIIFLESWTGFLSDYSKLKPRSDVSYLYLDENRLGTYSKFIIDPVVIHLHAGSKAKEKVSEEKQTDLKNYMHDAIVKAIEHIIQLFVLTEDWAGTQKTN